MNYRREIDGLRGLAVMSVMLFHAGFEAFSGGFVGVDVFFVISGYLITTIILAELEQGKFSIVNFYERRARRILPALFLVMLVCIPFAWFWLLPQDMKSFSQSLVAVSVFASNILFWRESGYFDTVAELKPLLHTWSLAVEEQYYVLFPLFLMLFWKLGKRWILITLGLVFLASLALAQWGAYAKPAAAFYLLPTRGWELLIGAFVAFYFSSKRFQQPPRAIAELGGLIGILLFAYSIFSFNSHTPFPSLHTLAPTIGAALIILFSSPFTSLGRLLGSHPLVGIGLISYSAYLWHQPLLAFARYREFNEPNQILFGLLLIASFIAAYFTWKFIEKPFRNKNLFSRKSIFIYGLLVSLIFTTFGTIGHLSNGFRNRLTVKQAHILRYEEPSYTHELLKNIYRMGDCFLKDEQDSATFSEKCQALNSKDSVLVWGDSHAAALSYGLRMLFPDVSQYTASGCPPIKDAILERAPKCKSINDFVFVKLSELAPRKIFLHANWVAYERQDPIANLHKTITLIKEILPSAEIFVIGPVPHWQPSLPVCLARGDINLDREYVIETPSIKKLLILDNLLRDEMENQNIHYLSPIKLLCSNSSCQVSVIYDGKVEPIAWDSAHLTEAGSVILADKLLKNN